MVRKRIQGKLFALKQKMQKVREIGIKFQKYEFYFGKYEKIAKTQKIFAKTQQRSCWRKSGQETHKELLTESTK